MTPSPSPSPLPWDVRNVVRLYLAGIVGITLLGVGWYGASGSGELGTQVAWVNVSAIGLIVAGTGNVLWLVQGHRAVRARERAVHERATSVADRLEPAPTDRPLLVTVVNGTRAHLPDCPLVRGKRTVVVTGDADVRCEACAP